MLGMVKGIMPIQITVCFFRNKMRTLERKSPKVASEKAQNRSRGTLCQQLPMLSLLNNPPRVLFLQQLKELAHPAEGVETFFCA